MVDPRDKGAREARVEGDDDSDSKEACKGDSRARDDDESDDDDDDDDDDDAGGATSLSEARAAIASGSLDELARLRREKRLAMNRASARERRRRKKVLIETLEEQVQELSKRNQSLQTTNTGLRARIEQLEHDLAQARALVSRHETSRASASLPMVNLPDAFAAAAHHESIRNALLAAGAADEAALHQAAALSMGSMGTQSMAPAAAVAGYLGSPAIINDVLAQREILNAQVMAERHRRAAILESATLNQLRQVQHNQLGLGGLLGQNTLAMSAGSTGIGRALVDHGRMTAARKDPVGETPTFPARPTSDIAGSPTGKSKGKVSKKKSGSRKNPRPTLDR